MTGEPLTLEEVYTCLKLLMPPDKETTEPQEPSSPSDGDLFFNLFFLPPVIMSSICVLLKNNIHANIGSKCRINNKINSSLGFPRVICIVSRYVTENILQRFCRGHYGYRDTGGNSSRQSRKPTWRYSIALYSFFLI